MNTCINCNKATTNNKFCSRSCANSYNNKGVVRNPRKIKMCFICGIKPVLGRSKFCSDCQVRKDDPTLSDVQYNKLHKSSGWALVRTRARAATKHLPKVCSICGYSRHVEVCHLNPISSFPLDTPLSVVNSLSNLVLLCPNHHWELDNGMLFT